MANLPSNKKDERLKGARVVSDHEAKGNRLRPSGNLPRADGFFMPELCVFWRRGAIVYKPSLSCVLLQPRTVTPLGAIAPMPVRNCN